MAITTTSKDPNIQAMANGLPSLIKCPWQMWHFINYTRVQEDMVLLPGELFTLNWTSIVNSLAMKSWTVFNKKFVDPKEALDPTKMLPVGWVYGEIERNGVTFGVAYYLTTSNVYHVSIARFMRYN